MIKYRHQEDQVEHERLSKKTALSFKGAESRTIQSEKRNCDLNFMIGRFGIGPLARPIDAASFGEIDRDLDLMGAHALIEQGKEAFMALPAKTREHFRNDPLALLAAIQDERRRDELEALGVFKESPKAEAGSGESGSPPKAERDGDE